MKFKVDENLPVEVAQILRQADYDVTTVHDEYLTGAVDAAIATACQTEGRIIMSRTSCTAPDVSCAENVFVRLVTQDG